MVLSLQKNSVLIERVAGTSEPQEVEVNAMLQPMEKDTQPVRQESKAHGLPD